MDKTSSLGAQHPRFDVRGGGFEIISYKRFKTQRVASEDLV